MLWTAFLFMKKGDRFSVTIEALAFEGKGLAKIDGKVVFVPKVAPEDVVEIEIVKNKKDFAEAKVTKIIKPSQFRIEPPCQHFDECGGCSFQNIAYEEQLRWKTRFVIDSFEKIAKVEIPKVNEVLSSQNIFHYRNKTEFTFSEFAWQSEVEFLKDKLSSSKKFALGYHVPQRFDKVLDINECLLQPRIANEILNLIRSKAIELQVSPYNIVTHVGFLRNLVFRYSFSEKKLMTILIVTTQIGRAEEQFLNWYKYEFPKSDLSDIVILAFNDSFSPVAIGTYKAFKGEEYLFESLLGYKFKISPFSFFQVNPVQAEKLIEFVVQNIEPETFVWDLYCGAGTISLPISSVADFVIGFELNEGAVNDARENANINKVGNVLFYAKDLHSKQIVNELKAYQKPDIIVVDPPRSGLHKNLVKTLLEIQAPKIIYVSCNPTTQARDIEMLKDLYKLKLVQPIDMFPHTYHIENIAILKLL